MSYIQIFSKKRKKKNEVYPMPWRSDAYCYNFHEPEVFIPEDRISEMITTEDSRCYLSTLPGWHYRPVPDEDSCNR